MTNVSNNNNFIPGIETQASSHSKDRAKQEYNKTRHIGKVDNIVNEVFEVKGGNSKSIGTNFRDSSVTKLDEGANKNVASSVNNCFVTSSKNNPKPNKNLIHELNNLTTEKASKIDMAFQNMKNNDISVIKDIVNGVAILGILDRNSPVLSAVLEKFTSKSGHLSTLNADTFSQDEGVRSTFCVVRNGVALLDQRTIKNFNVWASVQEEELPLNSDVHQLFQNFPQSTDTQPAFPLPPGLNLNPVAALSDEEQETIFNVVGEFIYAVVEDFISNKSSILLEQKSSENTGKEKNVDLLPQTFQLKERDVLKENKGTESNTKRVPMPVPDKTVGDTAHSQQIKAMRKEIEEKIEEKKEEKWEQAKEEARIYSDKKAEISKEDYEKKEKHHDSVKQ